MTRESSRAAEGERAVGTRRLLRARGYYVEGQLPYGYVRGQTERERNVLVPHPDQAAKVVRIFELAAAGKTLAAISAEVGMAKSQVHKRLQNRIYLGEIRSGDEWVGGRHPALVDTRLFAMAQREMRDRRGRPTGGGATQSWLLRDVAVCAQCGSRMASVYGPKRQTSRRYYYMCRARCGVRLVPQHIVEAPVPAMVLSRLRGMVGATRKERKAILLDVRRIERAWTRAGPSERRTIVALLANEARMERDREPEIGWRSAEDLSGLQP